MSDLTEGIKKIRAVADIPVVDCKEAWLAHGEDLEAALQHCREAWYKRARAAGMPRGISFQVGF